MLRRKPARALSFQRLYFYVWFSFVFVWQAEREPILLSKRTIAPTL